MSDYPNVHSYFQVGGYYLIGIGVHPDARTQATSGKLRIAIGREAVAIFDSRLSLVGFYPI